MPTPPLGNGRVRLRALTTTDLEWLRTAETSEYLAFRWRLRGGHPNPRDFVDQLYNGALALFVVETPDAAAPLGLLSAYQADHRNGHCRMAAARMQPGDSLDSSFLAGITVFFDYLFGGWPFRKLYLETPEFNLPQFASAVDRGFLRVEARLEEYVFLADRYWDVLFLSISRDDWGTARSSTIARRLLGEQVSISQEGSAG